MDANNNTLLQLAIHHNSDKCLPILLQRLSTKINQSNCNGTTPLICATKHNNPHFVPQLLEAGTQVNQQDNWGCSALHYAEDAETIEILCQHDANVNLPTFSHINQPFCGYTPLHIAAYNDNLDAVETLICYGADPLLETPSDGLTAQAIASIKNFPKIVAYLDAIAARESPDLSSDDETP